MFPTSKMQGNTKKDTQCISLQLHPNFATRVSVVTKPHTGFLV